MDKGICFKNLKGNRVQITLKLDSTLYNTYPVSVQNLVSIEGQLIEKFQFQTLSADHL
jgi:hypothetical protein